MSSTPLELEHLRRRIDEIDDRLQDLLIDRAEIVSLVAASKKDGNQPAFQPAREAEIIRRLVRRHRGSFPVANLVRIWREMLAATVGMQSPFSVAVFASADRQNLWDVAREHYGSNTPMMAYDTASAVIRAVTGRKASVGVLPTPKANEADPWWPRLLSVADPPPQIIARLPFHPHCNIRVGDVEALTIGFGVQQESSLDHTLVALECAEDVSRARILKVLSAVGLVCTLYGSCNTGPWLRLIEVEGFVPMADTRLEGLRAELGGAINRLVPMGGYAVPLPASAFAAKD
jgi:chorismate mutase / prephenate dehydratase